MVIDMDGCVGSGTLRSSGSGLCMDILNSRDKTILEMDRHVSGWRMNNLISDWVTMMFGVGLGTGVARRTRSGGMRDRLGPNV